MSSENVRERKERRHYTFVIVPNAKSEQTRSFSISLWGGVGLILASFLVVIALVFAAILYTPLGAQLPISSPQLEKQYGRQIGDIQKQLYSLLQEINGLRTYNFRLRKIMGDRFQDSLPLSRDTLLTVPGPAADQLSPPQEQEGTVATSEITDQQEEELVAVRTPHRRTTDFAEKLPLTLPVDGFISRGFDAQQYHYGIDFAGKEESPIVAAADGNVIFSGWTYDDGLMVMISHAQGYMTVYKHNRTLLKQTGDAVRRGDVIALLGNTGRTSSGPHLHFEVWKDGVEQDPAQYLLRIQ